MRRVVGCPTCGQPGAAVHRFDLASLSAARRLPYSLSLCFGIVWLLFSRFAVRLLLAGQRPSSLNASGLIRRRS